MSVRKDISNRLNDFTSLCDSHNVKYLYVFGSSLTERFDEENSDIDFLVEIDADDPIDRGEKLMSLWDNFEGFFNRKVDLLTNNSIRNPFLQKSIDSTKVLIYDGTGKKIFI